MEAYLSKVKLDSGTNIKEDLEDAYKAIRRSCG